MEGRRELKTLIAVILGFKLWGVLLIVLLASDRATLETLFALNWPYLAVLAVVVAIPGLFWFRLIKGRLKRAKWQYQEWHVDDRLRRGRAKRAKLQDQEWRGD